MAAVALAGEPSLAPPSISKVLAEPVGEGDVCIVHRGRRVSLHADGCVAAWKASPEALFASLQPRGALFEEPEGPSLPLRGGWLLFACYVVLGLVAGAACAYVAVARALRPLPWFFAGLVANVLALGVLLTRPPGDASALPAGVPPGLTKVPTTRRPARCPSCAGENHPSARACAECGAALAPAVDPETARL